MVISLGSYINILEYVFFSRFGRRTSFFSLLFMEVSVSIITCFSPTYTAFTVLRTLNGVTFPALFQIPFILCKSASDGPIFCQLFKPFFARSGNNGSRLPYLRRHDDLFVLCCRVNDPGRGGLHFQLVAGFGICQFLSFYRVIQVIYCRSGFRILCYVIVPQCLKSSKMSHLNFPILAFSTNLCPIISDLSGNTV